MPFQGVHYPPETVAIMSRVLDECMATLVNGHPADPTTLEGVRVRCAQIILGAVADGEDDPEALKLIVFQQIASGLITL